MAVNAKIMENYFAAMAEGKLDKKKRHDDKSNGKRI